MNIYCNRNLPLHLVLLGLYFFVSGFLAKNLSAQTNQQVEKKQIEILGANVIERNPNISDASRLVGKVKLGFSDAILTCDSAYRFDNGKFEVFSNVYILESAKSGEKSEMWAEYAILDPENDTVDIREGVRFNHEEFTIECPSLTYGLESKLVSYSQRAKIIESASNKFIALEEMFSSNEFKNLKNFLVYVSSNIDKETNTRSIDEVMNILNNLGFHIDKFTAGENKIQREYIIDKLTKQIIDGIVAIKCLDEGVDVPSIEHAFILASSSNPKEFIQRRGRVLRKSKGKKFAYIYDFLVVPDINNHANSYDIGYLKKELGRFLEFSKLAVNRFEAEDKISEIKEKFGLLHL